MFNLGLRRSAGASATCGLAFRIAVTSGAVYIVLCVGGGDGGALSCSDRGGSVCVSISILSGDRATPGERKPRRGYKGPRVHVPDALHSRGSGQGPVCNLLRTLPESTVVYGLQAMSMKLATFFLSFARSSSCRYIMWPAS